MKSWKTILCVCALAMTALGGTAATAAAPFTLTLSGPPDFVPNQALSGPFSGTLSAASVGVPSQTIELFVDGQSVATAATTFQGKYTISLPPFTGTADRTVRATAFGGTPLETSAVIVVQVTRYALDVQLLGSGTGTVTSNPPGINCPGTCVSGFAATSTVVLTATAGSLSTFSGWSGACLGTGSCSVTMNAPSSVSATFTRIQYLLTVGKTGPGAGTVTSTPAGISCGTDCSELYDGGTVVTVSAAAASGSFFAGWSGGGCSGTGPCVITLNSSTSVTATFQQIIYPLTVTKVGTGSGLVTSSPAGINCGTTCTANYSSGTPVLLTAFPGPGSFFAGWSGACSGTGSCAVTMNSAVNVTANFILNQYQLTVTKSGSGTVTSSPAGINCGTDCSEIYNAGTLVTLYATAGTFATFNGWSGGGCSGTGTCTVTMNAATTVNASF